MWRSKEYEEYLCTRLNKGLWKDGSLSRYMYREFHSGNISYEVAQRMMKTLEIKISEQKQTASESFMMFTFLFLATVFLAGAIDVRFLILMLPIAIAQFLCISSLCSFSDPFGFISSFSGNYTSIALNYVQKVIVQIALDREETDEE